LAASNSSRKYFFIQNISSGVVWINFGVAAVTTMPSIRLQAGDTFSMEGAFISTESINIIAVVTTKDFTAKEGS
jgi:hypothetical protein